jgi:hypothetical protein
MSRRFAGVGVEIAPARLQELAEGAQFAEDESVDVNFAIAATAIRREQRLAKFERRRRLGVYWLIVAGLVLVALNFLVCMGYVLFSLVEHASLF